MNRSLKACLFGFAIAALVSSAPAEIVLKSQWSNTNSEPAHRLAVQGNYTFYTTLTGSLGILDTADAGNPKLVGKLAVDGTAGLTREVAINGDVAYVAAAHGGYVVNIADKTKPTKISYISGLGGWSVWSVTVDGNRLYVGMDRKVSIYDISTATAPVYLGKFSTTDEVRHVEVRNNLAILAAKSAGLIIVDVTDGANPTLVGKATVKTGEQVLDIALQGSYAIAATFIGQAGSLSTIDISNSATPTFVKTVAAGSSALDAVDVYGSTAAITGTTGELSFFDITDPAEPAKLANWGLPTPIQTGADIKAVGGKLYVTDQNAGLRIYDTTQAGLPKLVGLYPNSVSLSSVTVSGAYAYSSDLVTGITPFDFFGLGTPVPQPYVLPNILSKTLVASGDRLYSVYRGNIEVFSLDQGAAPVSLGVYEGENNISDLKIIAGKAFAVVTGTSTNSPDGIRVLNLADPAAPTLVSSFGSTGLKKIQVAGEYLYGLTSDGTVRVLYAADPSNLDQASEYSLGASEIAVHGNYLFVAGSKLSVYDISNPTTLTFLGAYKNGADQILAGNDRALLVRGGTVELIDIRNLGMIHAVGSYDLGQTVTGASLLGATLLATTASSFSVLDTSLPATETYPQVQVTGDASAITVQWSDQFTGYTLHRANDLNGSWTAVTETPSHDGGVFSLTAPVSTDAAVFYRLSK